MCTLQQVHTLIMVHMMHVLVQIQKQNYTGTQVWYPSTQVGTYGYCNVHNHIQRNAACKVQMCTLQQVHAQIMVHMMHVLVQIQKKKIIPLHPSLQILFNNR